jgi:hypothetical protein
MKVFVLGVFLVVFSASSFVQCDEENDNDLERRFFFKVGKSKFTGLEAQSPSFMLSIHVDSRCGSWVRQSGHFITIYLLLRYLPHLELCLPQ